MHVLFHLVLNFAAGARATNFDSFNHTHTLGLGPQHRTYFRTGSPAVAILDLGLEIGTLAWMYAVDRGLTDGAQNARCVLCQIDLNRFRWQALTAKLAGFDSGGV